jgi:hypothetical protein
MKRKTQPRLETLESRALLSGGSGTVLHHAHRHAHFAQIGARASSNLRVTLTTNQAVYQPGQVVRMTLTETNMSDHPMRVDDGPSLHAFYITHNGKVVWRSITPMTPDFLRLRVLMPGQSVTYSAQWTVQPRMAGMFEVHVQRFPNVTAMFRVIPVGSSPTKPVFPISPVSGGGATTPGGTGATHWSPSPTPTPPIIVIPPGSGGGPGSNGPGPVTSPGSGGGAPIPGPLPPIVIGLTGTGNQKPAN